jgi:hypothetical protein
MRLPHRFGFFRVLRSSRIELPSQLPAEPIAELQTILYTNCTFDRVF